MSEKGLTIIVTDSFILKTKSVDFRASVSPKGSFPSAS